MWMRLLLWLGRQIMAAAIQEAENRVAKRAAEAGAAPEKKAGPDA